MGAALTFSWSLFDRWADRLARLRREREDRDRRRGQRCESKGCTNLATRHDHFLDLRTCDKHVPYLRVMAQSRRTTRRRRGGAGASSTTGPRPLP